MAESIEEIVEESIEEKINKLGPDEREEYDQKLAGIYEWREDCVKYGAKDPVNLPREDRDAIRNTLYQEMFG